MAKRKKKSLGDEGYLLDQSYGRQDWDDDPFNMNYRSYRGMQPDPFGLTDDPFRGYGAPDSTHMAAVDSWLDSAQASIEGVDSKITKRDCPTAFYHLRVAQDAASQARAHAVSIQDKKEQYVRMEEERHVSDNLANVTQHFVNKCLKTKSRK